MLDVSDLRLIKAIIDTGSLNKAAAKVHLTQPAISKKVRRLEDRLGHALFWRGQSGMIPTEYAKNLLQLGVDLLRHADILSRQIELSNEYEGLELRVGVSPAIEQFLLGEVMIGMFARHPKLGFKIEISSMSQLIRQIEEGSLDLAVSPYDEALLPPNMLHVPFLVDKFALAVRPEHPLTHKDTYRMKGEDFYQYPFVMPELSTGVRERIETFLAKQDKSNFTNIECHNFTVAVELARKSNAVAAGPALAFQAEVRKGNLVQISRPMRDRWNPSFLLRPETALSSAVTELIEEFRLKAKQLKVEIIYS